MHPIDTGKDFVFAPLSSITGQPALPSALSAYQGASYKDQTEWTNAYRVVGAGRAAGWSAAFH